MVLEERLVKLKLMELAEDKLTVEEVPPKGGVGLVPHSNQVDTKELPFGLTKPFKVAELEVTLVAALVVTEGAEAFDWQEKVEALWVLLVETFWGVAVSQKTSWY